MVSQVAHHLAMQVAVTLILVRMGFLINRFIKSTATPAA